jgi:hypothetical protein
MESFEQPLYSDQLVESEYSSNMNAARQRWSDEEMSFIDSEPYGIEAMAA